MNYIKTKQLCETILKEENEKKNLDINYHCCGKIQYFNKSNNVLKKILKYSFQKKNLFGVIVPTLAPVFSNGYYNNATRSLMVFLNGKTILNPNDSTHKLLLTIYHELYHAEDDKRRKDTNNKLDFSNYDNFFSDIDHLIYENFSSAQFAYFFGLHDNFMFGILASKKGVEKTKIYIEKNRLKVDEEKLKNLEKKHEYLYCNANLSKSLDFIIDNYFKIKKKERFDNSFFEIFLTNNGDFKSLDEIINNQNFHLIDHKIIRAFFSTKKFINSFNISNTSPESQQILFEILNNTDQKQPNQIVIQEHKKFEALDMKKKIKIKQIKQYSLIITIAILSKFIAKKINVDDSFIHQQLSNFLFNLGTALSFGVVYDIILKFCVKYKFNITKKEIDDLVIDLKESIEKLKEGKKNAY